MTAGKFLGALAVAVILAAGPLPHEGDGLTYVGEYRVTAYNYYEGGGENYFTAGGWTPVPYYTIAAPEAFDLGTVLFIEGVGEVQVQDRGAFPDDRLDIHIGYDPIETWDDKVRAVYIVNNGEGEKE